jgi:uncharacterized protein (DUF433 family)
MLSGHSEEFMPSVDTRSPTYVTSAEAAFIAGVSDREVNRVIDEHIVPEALVRKDDGRRFARLASVYIAFYFQTEPQLTATARRSVLSVLTDELKARTSWNEALRLEAGAFARLTGWLRDFRTKDAPYLHLDLLSFVLSAQERSGTVDDAMRHVGTDPAVMGGMPVFKGTRVPVETVVASLDAGVPLSRLKKSYPFLTRELAEAGRVYLKVRPRRGRPRRLSDDLPAGWKAKQTKVIHPKRA